MHQIVYISTRSAKMADDDLADILSISRRNNAAAGVTGMLLFNGRRFLQALEGEESAVRAIYDRVRADPRHIAMVCLSARAIPAREFGDWAMAYDEGDATGRGDFLARVDALTAGAGANVRAQFRSYAELRAA